MFAVISVVLLVCCQFLWLLIALVFKSVSLFKRRMCWSVPLSHYRSCFLCECLKSLSDLFDAAHVLVQFLWVLEAHVLTDPLDLVVVGHGDGVVGQFFGG